MKKSRLKKSSNDLILDGKNDEAIALLRKELKQWPDSHWHWGQLSSAYHEKRKYKLALRYAEKAVALQPKCPLTLWYCACVLCTFDVVHILRAYEIYRNLLKKGISGLDKLKCCNEGHEYNLGLLNDCRFGVGWCCRLLNENKEAIRWFKLFVKHHNPACSYPKDFAQKMLEKCNAWKVK
jgi:tetratricopeptide (TPR) repeat protein